MAQEKPKTSSWWRTQGGAVECTVSFGTSGAGTAFIHGNKLIVDVTTALTAEAAAMAITTPIAMRVLDVTLVRNGGGAATIDVLNGVGGTSITGGASAALSGDTDVVRATELDDAAYDVAKDAVFSITAGSATFAGLIIIDFIPGT
tara:strand:- start:929 stop:1366 length:438 start_codon:yes stop_codon:yes gene_type:complete